MSNNNTATATQAATSVERELVMVDPNELVIGDNERTRHRAASIRTHGVLEPISAVRDDQDRLVMRDGQCRTLAARDLGLAEVPVIVGPVAAGDEKAQNIDRIAHQWAHNEHHAGLSAREKAASIHQLRLAGVSATKIAREHLHVDKTIVDAAPSAATSTAAMDALAAQDSLTLEQAAIVADYDGCNGADATLLAAASEDASPMPPRSWQPSLRRARHASTCRPSSKPKASPCTTRFPSSKPR